MSEEITRTLTYDEVPDKLAVKVTADHLKSKIYHFDTLQKRLSFYHEMLENERFHSIYEDIMTH